ncbi:DUF2273 domain-containing protein [Lactobacillus xylocopicola]|uniref:DUF2273 domain-containing protein n=1 Tax=Lactobacillus xylocopicola TaxID=2976676 RepID=A0ABN6SQ08_9LACO|nr:DUF2273 domain-containing protein [Lactobacillus xylocopicola]BDR61232.1 hypothetical protein KIM322_14930 [Lactobacillus xylocopicola]
MKAKINQYLPEICGAATGLLVAWCFLEVGFFKTIFVIAMGVLGVLGGHYLPLLKNLRK